MHMQANYKFVSPTYYIDVTVYINLISTTPSCLIVISIIKYNTSNTTIIGSAILELYYNSIMLCSAFC